MSLQLEARGDVLRFTVRVQPRASRNEVAGVHGAALKVRVTAPPVEGAANSAVIALLAEVLGVPRGAVRIVSGDSSRNKVVEVPAHCGPDLQRLAG